ncbi:MAG: tetratricopeptide repeat protein, partial [Gemmataceae bacterium]
RSRARRADAARSERLRPNADPLTSGLDSGPAGRYPRVMIDSPSGGRAPLYVLAAVAFLAPTAFGPGGSDVFEAPKSFLLHAAAVALLGLAVTARRWVVPRDPVSVAVLLLALAAGVATVTSVDPARSFAGAHGSRAGLTTCLALACLYLAARTSGGSAERVRLPLAAVGAAAAGVCAYAAVQVAGLDPLTWEDRSAFRGWVRPMSTLGHPMQLGGFLAAALPLLLWLGGSARSRWAAAGYGLTAAAAVLILALALARGAWLGAAAGAAVGLLMHRRPSGRVLIAGLGLLLLAACLPGVRDRVAGLFVSAGRVELWRGCWALFLERPLTGHGPETLGLVYGGQLTPALWALEWNRIPDRAHNELLHQLVTQGAAGGLAAAALLAALAHAAWRGWRDRPQDRPVIAALTASLAACVVQLATGFLTLGCAVPFVIACGLLARLASGPEDAPGPPPAEGVPAWRGLAALALVAVLGWHAAARPAWAWALGTAASLDRSPAALATLAEAAALCPECDRYRLEYVAAAERLAERAEDPRERLRIVRRADAAAEAASRTRPLNTECHAALARTRLLLARAGAGTLDDALEPLERALELSPRNAALMVEAARSCLAAGDLERSAGYLDRAERTGMRHGSISAERAGLLLARSRYREAETALDAAMKEPWSNDPDGRCRALGMRGLLYLDTKRPAEAIDCADAMATIHAGWPMTWWIRGRALEMLGQREEAVRDYRKVLRLRPDHPQARAALSRVVAGK